MLFALTPHVCRFACHKRMKKRQHTQKLPITVPPASLLCPLSWCGESGTASDALAEGRRTHALITPEPCRAFWLCYSIQLTSSWRPSTRRLTMFVSLWCTSDLPMPCERNRCVTEIYFWCFSSSEQYFLCLIKICILARSVCIGNFNIKQCRGYSTTQVNSACLCCLKTLIPIFSTWETPLYVPFSGTSYYIRNRVIQE